MALNVGPKESVAESMDKGVEHNEMREELVAAGFESFGLAAKEGILARNKNGKIVYLRDEGEGYKVFDWDESPNNQEPLPRSVAVQEATRKLSA